MSNQAKPEPSEAEIRAQCRWLSLDYPKHCELAKYLLGLEKQVAALEEALESLREDVNTIVRESQG